MHFEIVSACMCVSVCVCVCTIYMLKREIADSEWIFIQLNLLFFLSFFLLFFLWNFRFDSI